MKKNKKNMSKTVTGGKPIALNTVIEDGLKELGVIGNNKRMNIENNQKTASKVSFDTIEKVDESNSNEAEDINYNKK